MKKLAKKALQNKQTVKGYASCTASCQNQCPSIPTEATASTGGYTKGYQWINGSNG